MTADNQQEPELRELVAQGGQILDRMGLVDYLGHVSARVPGTDRVVIKPKHSPRIKSLGSLTAADLVVIDLDGNQLGGGDPAPAEVYIHTEVYKARPDVVSVVHTHQDAATLLGVIEAPVLPLLHIPSTFIDSDIPLWPCPLLVTDAELGAQMAQALGGADFCHLQGHGIISVADSVERAVVGAVILEQLAEFNLRVLQTGRTPRVITEDEIARLRRDAAPVAGRWAYYRELVEQARTGSLAEQATVAP